MLAAGKDRSAESDNALSWLCERYWYPLYAYARHKGHKPDQAEDLVQGFFARILERHIFHNLVADRGRFRAFLLSCFHHFMVTEWAKMQTKKRGGGLQSVPLHEATAEQRYQHDFTDQSSPERDFDRAWALTLLDRVLDHLRAECEAEGKGGRFAVLQPFLQPDSTGGDYRQAALQLGISEGALRVMLSRMRKRFRDMVLQEIRQTVASENDVTAELRHLFMALGK